MVNKLPPNWHFIKTKNLCKVVSGSTPKTTISEFWNGDILWLTPKDLSNFKGTLIEDTNRKITKAGYASCSTSLLPIGTVMMSSRAPIGYLAIAGKEICTNQGFKNFICSEKINNYYLFYYLKFIVPLLKSNGSGTTFDELSKTKAENIEIPIPFPDEISKSLIMQEKIVKKLHSFFEEYHILKIKKEKIIDNYSIIYNSIISKFIQNNKYHFTNIRLSEICNKITDGSHNPPKKTLNGKPMLSARNIMDDRIVFDNYRLISNNDFFNENKRTEITPGDVLLTIVGTIGRTAVVNEKNDFTLQRSVAVFKPKEYINSQYLSFIFRTLKVQNYLQEVARGTAQKGVYLKTLRDIKIPIPEYNDSKKSLEIQDMIVKNILASFESCNKILTESNHIQKEIERLPYAILNKAFKGELIAE